MNKLLIASAVLAGAVLATTPKIVSNDVANKTQAMIDAINEMPFYQAKITEMESGWLSSSSTITVGLDFSHFAPQAPDKPPMEMFSINLNVDIDHGPLLASGLDLAHISVQLDSEKLKSAVVWDHAKPLYQLNAQIGLNGNLSYQDAIEKFQYTLENQVTFDGAAYKGEAVTQNGKLVYKGQWPTFAITSDEFSAQFTNLAIDSTIKGDMIDLMSYDKVPQYSGTLSIEKMVTSDIENAEPFNAESLGLSFESELDEVKQVARFSQTISLSRFDYGEEFGQDMVFDFEINQFDADTYVAINKFMYQSSTIADPEQHGAAFGALLQERLLTILKAEPELNIKRIKGTFKDGSLDAVLNTKIEKVEQLPANMDDPKFWLNHVNANSKINITKTLMETLTKQYVKGQLVANPQMQGATEEEITSIAEQQTPQYIAMLQNQGMIVEDVANNAFTFEFSLAEYQATLNGNPVPLPQ